MLRRRITNHKHKQSKLFNIKYCHSSNKRTIRFVNGEEHRIENVAVKL